MTSRVIVTGTRLALSADDEARLEAQISRTVWWIPGAVEVGIGDCPTGVDAYVARAWAVTLAGRLRVFEADWSVGRRAGPQRNARLVAWAAEADGAVCIAMPDPESHKGTGDTIERCIRAGIITIVMPRGCKPWS